MLMIIAPHVVAPGQMETASRMAHEVGESCRRMEGFVGRFVGYNRIDPNEVWSIVGWRDRASFDAWMKVRRFWWTTEDLHRVYAKGALVQEAEFFDLTGEQGHYFDVESPPDAALGVPRTDLPVTVVAPHLVKHDEIVLARRMIAEVGVSAKAAPGFAGRVELQSQRAEDRIWSVSSWRSHADFDRWKDARRFWWTPEDVRRVFPEGAQVEDAKQIDIVARQLPLAG